VSAAGYPSTSASPIGTDFDLSADPLYSLCTSTESNMQTPSRNRDSRRSRSQCGRAVARWCADERSRIGTRRSTSPKSYSPPALRPQLTINHPQVLYEGLRLRQPSTQETVVPDNASRQQAPATIQPFLNAYPVANGAEGGNGLAQFDASYSDPSSLNAYSVRVDQIVNSKISLFGRYDYSPSTLDQRGAFPPPYMVLSATESVSSSVQTFTLGMEHLIAPRLSNEIRVNYSNQRLGTKYFLDGFGGAVPLQDSLRPDSHLKIACSYNSFRA
jgi:hypothetical protein